MAFSFVVVLLIVATVEGRREQKTEAQAADVQSVSPRPVAIRIMFGELQSAARVYDGSLSLTRGSVVRLIPYRFFRDDTLSGPNSWKLTLKRVQFENRSGRPTSVAGGGAPLNIVPAGITAFLDQAENARARVSTVQGDFEFDLSSLSFGRRQTFFEGDIVVERVPSITRLNDDATGEQHDYPSLLQTRKGGLWAAWQAYRDRGDHIYVRRGGAAGSSAPERITGEKGDLYKTALGEDSRSRIHVVWSERTDRDWNLIERRFDGSSWSARVPITSGDRLVDLPCRSRWRR